MNPSKSEIHSQHKHNRRSGNRSYSETNRPKDKMYILGPAIVDNDRGDRLMISRDDSNFPFLVCNLSEDEMMQKGGQRSDMAQLFTQWLYLDRPWMFWSSGSLRSHRLYIRLNDLVISDVVVHYSYV